MIDAECVTGALPAVYSADNIDLCFPVEFRPGRWAIVTGEVVEEDGEVFKLGALSLHYGRCTGNLVVFSRLADAERFCRVLCGLEAPAC